MVSVSLVVHGGILVLRCAMGGHGRGDIRTLTVGRRAGRLGLVKRRRGRRIRAPIDGILGVHGGIDGTRGRRAGIWLEVSSEASGGMRLIADV